LIFEFARYIYLDLKGVQYRNGDDRSLSFPAPGGTMSPIPHSREDHRIEGSLMEVYSSETLAFSRAASLP